MNMRLIGMNLKQLTILTTIILLIAIVPNVSAATENYMAKLNIKTIYNPTGNPENYTWQPITKYLNITQAVDWSDIKITYADIDTDKTTIWFTITGAGNIINPQVPLSKTAPISCLRGTCTSDPTKASSNAIQLQLIDIVLTSKSTSSNITGSNPIYVYAIVGSDKKSLIKDGTLTFDAKGFTQESGWSSDKIADEIEVYFERNSGVAAGIDLTTTSPEPAKEWNDDWIKYTIENSGTYVFKVTYTETSPWGKDVDKEETYTLVVKGITTATTVTKAVAITPFDATMNEPKSVKMSLEGAFEPQAGITITADGENAYRITFSSLGEKQLIYKPTDTKLDATTVIFNVHAKETTTTANLGGLTNTLTGNQNPGTGEEDNTYLLLGSGIVIAAIAYVAYSKRKKSTKSYNIHGTAQ